MLRTNQRKARAKAAQHRSAFKAALSDFIALTENEIDQKMLAEVGGKFEELGRLADGIMDLTVAQGSDLGELNSTLSEVARILEGEIQKVLGNSSHSTIEKQWATLELGLSVNDVVSAMEEYIDAPAPNLRENMQVGVERFERFLEAFRNSDPSEMESVLIGKLEEQFDSVKSLGLDLMNGADRLRRKLTILDDKKTELDGLVESTLRGSLDPEKAKGLKIEAVLEMEINIHQTYSAIQRFVVGGSPDLSQEIADAFFGFKRYETNYRKFSLSPSEKEELRRVVGAFGDLHSVGLEVMEEIEMLNLDSSVLLSEVSKLDDVLRESFQEKGSAIAHSAVEKRAVALEAEKAIVVVRHDIRDYARRPNPEARDQLEKAQRDLNRLSELLPEGDLSEGEVQSVKRFKDRLAKIEELREGLFESAETRENNW